MNRKASIWIQGGKILTVSLHKDSYEEQIGDKARIEGKPAPDGIYRGAQSVFHIKAGRITHIKKKSRYFYER